MSDYVHKKVVRLPFPKELMVKLNVEDEWRCESYLKWNSGDLWGNKRDTHFFELQYSQERCYIDWVYYYTYGEKSGDFGSSRLLNPKELEIVVQYFNKLGIEYKEEDLRVVEYCYYNCCESPDYYDIENGDESEDMFLR